MEFYAYHTEDEELICKLDDEFQVVTVVGGPQQGHNPGYELAIYDARGKGKIAEVIRKINGETGRKA